jgi:hypothetical protein
VAVAAERDFAKEMVASALLGLPTQVEALGRHGGSATHCKFSLKPEQRNSCAGCRG